MWHVASTRGFYPRTDFQERGSGTCIHKVRRENGMAGGVTALAIVTVSAQMGLDDGMVLRIFYNPHHSLKIFFFRKKHSALH